MKSRSVLTVTNNEEYIRLRIFDGELTVEEGAADLLRLTQAQLRSARNDITNRNSIRNMAVASYRQVRRPRGDERDRS